MEAQILEAIEIDYIDESEVTLNHIACLTVCDVLLCYSDIE